MIRGASREHPADSVLRQEIKSQRRLETHEAAQTSHAVFAYYRWLGWLNHRQPIREQISRALELATQFASNPVTFPEPELAQKAVPGWLKDQMEFTPAWARSIQSEPKLWLRAKRGQGRELARKLGDCHVLGEEQLSDTLEYQGEQDLFRTPEFHHGEFELQDVSSQAVGWVCDPRPGETWWDACAGEGGKTLLFSELMQNKGLVWASDRAGWRLQRLKRRAGRAKVFNYRMELWDGSSKLPTKTKFDGVLVDAPCSGIGTWHRNPHARWTTTPNDVSELAELQKRMLGHATVAVKPGGKLVFAVCTLTRAETSAVMASFGEQFPDFEPLGFQNPLTSKGVAFPTVTLWPQAHSGNGMFIAAWRRR